MALRNLPPQRSHLPRQHPRILDYPLNSTPLQPGNLGRPFKASWAAAAAGGVGFRNVGNTCYLNSVLQCLIHTMPLVEKLHSYASHPPHPQQEFCSFCALRRLAISSMARPAAVYLVPHEFTDNLRKISSDFLLGRQEDAHEFLLFLLDNLDSKDRIIKDIFGGTCLSQLRCLKCGHCSSTSEPMNGGLSLEISDANTLTDALASFCMAEKIEDITCHSCKYRVLKEKSTKLDQAPPVIFLHLKRFRNQGLFINKIDKYVEYPLVLDLRPFISCPTNQKQAIYELYGVVVHRGTTASSGHYFIFIHSSPRTWHLMDDSRVEVVPEIHALEQRAYILFYVKRGSSPRFSSLMDVEDVSPAPVPSSIINDASHISVTDSIPSRAPPKKEDQSGPYPNISAKCVSDNPWILVERKKTKRRKQGQLPTNS